MEYNIKLDDIMLVVEVCPICDRPSSGDDYDFYTAKKGAICADCAARLRSLIYNHA